MDAGELRASVYYKALIEEHLHPTATKQHRGALLQRLPNTRLELCGREGPLVAGTGGGG